MHFYDGIVVSIIYFWPLHVNLVLTCDLCVAWRRKAIRIGGQNWIIIHAAYNELHVLIPYARIKKRSTECIKTKEPSVHWLSICCHCVPLSCDDVILLPLFRELPKSTYTGLLFTWSRNVNGWFSMLKCQHHQIISLPRQAETFQLWPTCQCSL